MALTFDEICIDAADISYVFGINGDGQVQSLYWGKRLRANDRFAEAEPTQGVSSFDGSNNTTPQEFVAWGGGL